MQTAQTSQTSQTSLTMLAITAKTAMDKDKVGVTVLRLGQFLQQRVLQDLFMSLNCSNKNMILQSNL